MLALKVLLEGFGVRHLGLQKERRNITEGHGEQFLNIAKRLILITGKRIYSRNGNKKASLCLDLGCGSLAKLTLHTEQVNTNAALAALF